MKDARTLKLLALGVATAILGSGIWIAQAGLTQWSRERQQMAQLNWEFHSARQLLPEVQQREQILQAIASMSKQVEVAGFEPSLWGERKLLRRQGPATRTEAAEFLSAIARAGSDQAFVADMFEIATVTPGAGLFHAPQRDDQGLTFGVAGTLHFPKNAVFSSIRASQ